MSESQIEISRLVISARETDEEEGLTQGSIPEWLKGTLVQTGPGLLDLPNFTMNDYLDGYAILTKFAVDASSVKLVKKYAFTESYQKALENGKPYFMEFGTTAKRQQAAGFFSKIFTTFSRDDMSDNCSASIYQCGSHLIASSATSFVYKVNPLTLALEEKFDAKKSLGQNGYGVHPLTDVTGTVWNMGFSVLPTLRYNVIKIPQATSTTVGATMSNASVVASISSRWSGGLAFNHSFGMTDKFIVFIEQPYIIKISRVLAATMKDYAVKDWLEWRGAEKNRFVIIEKDTGKVHSAEYMSATSFFFLHVVNCYEDGSCVFVDIATSKSPNSTGATALCKLRNNIIDDVDPSIIERFVVPLIDNVKKGVPEGSNLIQGVCNTQAQAIRKGNTIVLHPELLYSGGGERTAINPAFVGRKHTFIYASGSFLSLKTPNSVMAHSICKLNTETKQTILWTASNEYFPGESIFIPRKPEISSPITGEQEDDGVILTAISSTKESSKDFLVFIEGTSFKEIARVSFDAQLPIGMHCTFLPK